MNAEAAGRAKASEFREKHRLGTQALGDLVTIIEQLAGIDVAVLDAEPDEHGLTMRDPVRGTIIIGVARSRVPMRQRSTLAHELGHVLFGDWRENSSCDWSAREPEEVRADAFARHLLIPVEGLREFFESDRTIAEADLSAVVQRFTVSPAMAAITMCDAGFISEATKHDWMSLRTPRLAARFGWIDQYQALQADSDQRRAPQRLLARVIRGYKEGVVSAQAIATLRGIRLDQAEDELRDAGVVPVEHATVWADHSELPEADVDLAALDAVLSAADDDAEDIAAQGDRDEQPADH